jgi:NAD(P)-dependent dehydrogenase (short-subunit alcohol dehydrogenase family)
MMTELPDVARSCQVPRLLLEPQDYQNYIATESTNVIANQLVSDESLSNDKTDSRLPTLLALYMPPSSSCLGREVARLFLPGVDISIQRLLYEETIKNIKRGLGKSPELPRHPDGHVLASDAMVPERITDATTGAKKSKKGKGKGNKNFTGTQWDASLQKYIASRNLRGNESPTCYICRLHNPTPHITFPSMCQPCGAFNVAGSSLSLPQNLDLKGRVALVTGARLNLGYHTVLRLLRCGAQVIATTRYPRDAVARYGSEPDFHVWQDSLRVVGADFRAARDAFDLVVQVRAIVSTWGGKLDILINNAAQTLTDSIGKEEKAIERELLLQGHDVEKSDQSKMLVGHGYQPRVRGGLGSQSPGICDSGDGKTTGQPARLGTSETDASNTRTSSSEVSTTPEASSWVQSLSEIPYEDIISAHSINTFVPLILIRELMPLMRRDDNSASSKEKLASGYIVNVSSREGIFESSNTSGAKGGKHVHTNMSKAGLNMITETEASTAWKNCGVAMNTVDPGYMSAAPEFEDAHGGERPIGWEDGAGRVLWPVAIGEMAKKRVGEGTKGSGHVKTVWGRFLKHYGAVRVDVRLGRG